MSPSTRRYINGFSPENLPSKINNVGDNVYNFYGEAVLAGKAIENPVGDMVKRYLSRSVYVIFVIKDWAFFFLPDMLKLIKSGLSDEEYSKVGPNLTEIYNDLLNVFRSGLSAALDNTLRIVKGDGSVISNIKRIDRSFSVIFSHQVKLLGELIIQLKKFEAGATLLGHLNIIDASFAK
ncbi:hypothetical protein BASA61_003828, partial [Batrachochytrium salamandrivorans]